MIIRFKEPLCNRIFESRKAGLDKNGNSIMIKFAEGESSVIESEQKNKNARPKQFKTGMPNVNVDGELYYQVTITDKTTLEFLKVYCDDNGKAYWGGMIQEYNPLAENEAKAKEATRQAKLTLASTELDEQQLTAIAFRRFGFETYKFLKEKDYSGLKLEVMQFAMNEPDLFEEYLNDKDNNTTQYYLSMALAKGIIKLINAGGTVVWGDNGSEILKVARGKKALDDLSDFLKTSEGREVRNIINERLSEATVEAEVSKAKQSTKKETAKTE